MAIRSKPPHEHKDYIDTPFFRLLVVFLSIYFLCLYGCVKAFTQDNDGWKATVSVKGPGVLVLSATRENYPTQAACEKYAKTKEFSLRAQAVVEFVRAHVPAAEKGEIKCMPASALVAPPAPSDDADTRKEGI